MNPGAVTNAPLARRGGGVVLPLEERDLNVRGLPPLHQPDQCIVPVYRLDPVVVEQRYELLMNIAHPGEDRLKWR